MTKQTILCAIAFTFLFSMGCKKSDQDQPLPDEDALIRNYLRSINAEATRDKSGVYYQIINPGAGDPVIYTSTVTVNYKGSLLNGKQFDDVSNKAFNFLNVMQGWQIGINKIRTGGRIIIYVPSSLGYGKYVPKPEIPANSTLVYDIELVSFKK
ncbi:FKBP-type peptidyl-prolyl cis-trans isomerase [Pedobacter sp. JCM 36344]|uniref:FKBP-type peptidyl-prolyl cis-trans isomerase n=1 Tax=Pedobacter sp. JCM 36344 TaxID=3374280 RepID=UPI0039784C3E